MDISNFTGRIKINANKEKTVLVVKNGYLIEKIYAETIDSYRVGDLPPRSDTVIYMSHSGTDYCDVMIAYDYCDKTSVTTITYPSPESLYSDSQYEISCYLCLEDTESIEITNDSGETIKLKADDLGRILGIDMIDMQTIL